jgi:hypothetical protein
VTSERRRVATLVVFTTLGLIVALGVQPVAVDRILAAYLLALAGIASPRSRASWPLDRHISTPLSSSTH